MWQLAVALTLAQASPPPDATAPLPAPTKAQGANEITYRPSIDLPITIGALGLAKAFSAGQVYPSEPFKTPVLACLWCDRRLNRLDRWAAGARDGTGSAAGNLSWATLGASGLVSWGLLAVDTGASTRSKVAGLGVSFESVAVTLNLASLTKILVRRARPYTHDAGYQGLRKSDDNWSYFSGHTASAFALVVSTAKVAGLRDESSGRKKKILAIGLPLAALTGYFRVAAGNHYLTDVLTGAVVGSSLGVLVPKWHVNLGGNRDVSVMPASIQGGGAIMVTW